METSNKKRIAFLTSSRADFGIYFPLIEKILVEKKSKFIVDIIAFGSHLSELHGNTIKEIEPLACNIIKIETLLASDNAVSIDTSIGICFIRFADFWNNNKNKYSTVFCLGDRYEMFAAVYSGLPFNINFTHIHGGETTEGSLDNIYRHSISLASTTHFVSLEDYKNRLINLLGEDNQIYHVGALSLDKTINHQLYSIDEFYSLFKIDLNIKTVLFTFHPESDKDSKTIKSQFEFIIELINKVSIDYQIIVSQPNTDKDGSKLRTMLNDKFKTNDRVILSESLGFKGYFTAIKNCSFLLGNSSSGIIEAASFKKFVINVGDRQKGRIYGMNVLNSEFNMNKIKDLILEVENSPTDLIKNIYYNGGASDKIINWLENA